MTPFKIEVIRHRDVPGQHQIAVQTIAWLVAALSETLRE
jgi:hypothetical protein